MFTAYDVQAILSHCPKMNLNLCIQAGLSRLEQMQLLLLTYELYNVYMAQKPDIRENCTYTYCIPLHLLQNIFGTVHNK